MVATTADDADVKNSSFLVYIYILYLNFDKNKWARAVPRGGRRKKYIFLEVNSYLVYGNP